MFQSSSLDQPRTALAGIVATLIAALGLGTGDTAAQISRAVRLQILRILRPAEAALRRLIFVAAHELTIEPETVVPMSRAKREELRNRIRSAAQRPGFKLCDPRVRMTEGKRIRKSPRIFWIPPTDPTIPALLAARSATTPAAPEIETPADANAHLRKRLAALQSALEDIPKYARRLIRWQARQKQLAELRPVYTSPLRTGRPPSYRTDRWREPLRDVDRVLYRCHLLAWEARRADTS